MRETAPGFFVPRWAQLWGNDPAKPTDLNSPSKVFHGLALGMEQMISSRSDEPETLRTDIRLPMKLGDIITPAVWVLFLADALYQGLLAGHAIDSPSVAPVPLAIALFLWLFTLRFSRWLGFCAGPAGFWRVGAEMGRREMGRGHICRGDHALKTSGAVYSHIVDTWRRKLAIELRKCAELDDICQRRFSLVVRTWPARCISAQSKIPTENLLRAADAMRLASALYDHDTRRLTRSRKSDYSGN
jgi:hypothetical protein